MASVRANLLDEDEELVGSVTVESDETYAQNGYFRSPDGGLYLIAEVKAGEPPVDVELTAVWIDGHRPT
jgi:hypothetical protein